MLTNYRHDMRNIQKSIACIGSNVQRIPSEVIDAFLARLTASGSVNALVSNDGERRVNYEFHRNVSMVQRTFPSARPGQAVQPFSPQHILSNDHSYIAKPVQLGPAAFPRCLHEMAPQGSIPKSKRSKVIASLQRQTYLTFVANVHYESRTLNLKSTLVEDGEHIDPQQQTETSISIYPKPWLLGRGFALSYSTSGQGWLPQIGFQFRQYNIRSEEALIFEFCLFGNVEGVRSLLRRREASPFDTDPEGWTPLHVCSVPCDGDG